MSEFCSVVLEINYALSREVRSLISGLSLFIRSQSQRISDVVNYLKKEKNLEKFSL
ncbi:hypothetical protein [Calothrix sp. NIES-2100]|uniref:hypothetical protein n=1 Tax=Calothrix sp. NIES-2100 TaxID=1954172 RepID=UPI0030D8287C